MGLLRTIALTILGFSTFVFIVLFGRLPFFRYRAKSISLSPRLTNAGKRRLVFYTGLSGYIFPMEYHTSIPVCSADES
ncbi:hypothetical protein BDW62DRAFT_50598 [Aspergillus aurantiobrunneus]